MVKRVASVLAATSVVVAFAGSARAAPPPQDEQTICQLDASRLCQDYVPDVDQITACMMAKRKQLSSACRNALDAGMKKRAHGN